MGEKCPNCGTECEVRRCQYLPDGGSDADDCPRFVPVSVPHPCPPGRGIGECIYCVPLPDPEVQRLREEVASLTAERDAAVKEVAAMDAELEGESVAQWKSWHWEDRRALEAAESRIAALEGALEFYADPGTYFGIAFPADRPCGAFLADFDDCEGGHKPGMRARALLATPEAQGEPSRKEDPHA